MRQRLTFGVVVALALASMTGAAGPWRGEAAHSATTPKMIVTMFSDPGDFIGGGIAQEFDSSNALLGGTFGTSELLVTASGGTSGNAYFGLDIAPPSGSTFHIGYYPRAQNTPFRASGYPGVDIDGDGRGCSAISGDFEVRDLATSGSTITRLDLLYEQHCERGVPALFGQIQVGEPFSSGVIVSSSSITWPALSFGGRATEVPVYVRNQGGQPVTLGNARLVGSDPGVFSIARDSCSSQVLATGSSCYVYVGFVPRQYGARTADLQLSLGARTDTIQLDGDVSAGVVGLTMTSDSGDGVGQGQSYHFTPANALVWIYSGAPNGIEMAVLASDGQWWHVDIYPGAGHVLAPGTYPNATSYPANGGGNALSVYGDGRGCDNLIGSFTVYQAVFDPIDNSVQHFKARFVQHCDRATPALYGTVLWHSESVVSPSPDVSRLAYTAQNRIVKVSWRNPASQHFAYTVLRVQPAGPVSPMPFTGTAVYSGTGTSATIAGLNTGARYVVTAFTVDQYGNVSPAERLPITGP